MQHQKLVIFLCLLLCSCLFEEVSSQYRGRGRRGRRGRQWRFRDSDHGHYHDDNYGRYYGGRRGFRRGGLGRGLGSALSVAAAGLTAGVIARGVTDSLFGRRGYIPYTGGYVSGGGTYGVYSGGHPGYGSGVYGTTLGGYRGVYPSYGHSGSVTRVTETYRPVY